jgi:poly(beta-D-mannuronate) lyase
MSPNFSSIFCVLFFATTLSARDIVVKSAIEFKAALSAAASGDVVLVESGTYSDIKIKFTRGGTATRPLTVRAKVPGEVILNGTSDCNFNFPHVVVDGLFFYKGTINPGEGEDNSVIRFSSQHGVLKNTAIVDYNPRDFKTSYYWIFFDGSNNTVERCYFKGKNNKQPLIGNAIEESRYNAVKFSYFKNIPYLVLNGREIIRVWGSGKFDEKGKDGAYFTVEGNLFDRADGEGAEIISLKSNYNQVLNNTVIATAGCINIRRGSNNIVKGNVILGQGFKQAQGLRMSGANNTVVQNYVSGTEYGIRVSTGEYIGSALTPAYEPHVKDRAANAKNSDGTVTSYPQVKKLMLAQNVIANVKSSCLEIGTNYKDNWPASQMILLPEDSDILNNRFITKDGGPAVEGSLPDGKTPMGGITAKPNRFKGNVILGEGKIRYKPAENGFKIEPLPSNWSEKKELSNFKVLTAQDVGPAWVMALRDAKKFPMEDDRSCYPADEGTKDKGSKDKSSKDSSKDKSEKTKKKK